MASHQLINKLTKKENTELMLLKSMQKLEIKDGDIIVLRHPKILKTETMINTRSQFKKVIEEFTGYRIKVLILEEGMEIGVLRPDLNRKDI